MEPNHWLPKAVSASGFSQRGELEAAKKKLGDKYGVKITVRALDPGKSWA